MIKEYNRHRHRGPFYPLNSKGYHQLQRNDSKNIWALLEWTQIEASEEFQENKNNELEKTFQTTIIEKQSKTQKSMKQDQEKEEHKKTVNFQVTQNSQNSPKKSALETTKAFTRSTRSRSQLPPTVQKQQKYGMSEFAKLKRKSVEKYIKDLIPYTRTLSNTAFTKLYQRPCPQAYGNKNTHQICAFYGNFMKTHNIQPHTLDNKPDNYQTFTSALNFGKRTKLDLEDRWKKIQRQLAKNLDYRELAEMKAVGEIEMNDKNKEDLLKQNINDSGNKLGRIYEEKKQVFSKSKSIGKLTGKSTRGKTAIQQPFDDGQTRVKRSLSSDKPIYFIYKYHEEGQGYDCTRYARDRHGITCYVDPTFRENDQALTAFLKRKKSIYPQKCRQEDMNIDNIRIKNYEESTTSDLPRHYLVPCVETPYEAAKYSRKKKARAQTNDR